MSERSAACFGREPETDGWPSVSVVIPVRNEAPDLAEAVASVLAWDYPGELDVCLAVAPSEDGTEAVAARLAADDDRVLVVANPAGVTPAALNRAVDATCGSIVVRVDGHAALPDGYIRHAVHTMCRTGAVNVGGMQVPMPVTPFEHAVAAATTSWMGTGGATYRVGGTEGPVDTVYLGVFDRAAGDAVGWFDETLLRNQDYELNIRLRRAGGTIWFDPRLQVGYRPRPSVGALAQQYYEYGVWKAEVLRRYPDSVRLRQLAPAALPIALASLVVASRWRAASVVAGAYAGVVLTASTVGARRTGSGSCRLATAIVTMHLAWGVGFDGAVVRRAWPRRRSTGSR